MQHDAAKNYRIAWDYNVMISTIETCSPGGDIHVFFPKSKMEGRIVEWCEGPQQHQLKRKKICNTEWKHGCMYPKVPMTRVVT
jgi:hypothetical protein